MTLPIVNTDADGLVDAFTSDCTPYVRPLQATGAMEVIVRRPDGLLAARMDAAGVDVCAKRLPEIAARRLATFAGRLRSPRRSFAGLDLTEPRVMGIINTTPDSFSDAGMALEPHDAMAQGEAMREAGAAILDVGGESTRPGAEPVDRCEETGRILPVITHLADAGALVSVDSRKADVMQAAIAAGARIVNDVSALTHDPRSMEVVAEAGVPVILMHALGDPRTMQDAPSYDHVSLDIHDYLESRIDACLEAGIARHNIAIDPGIGFGKTLAHNMTLLGHLALFRALGCPILLGASRKRFIGRITGEERPANRLGGSIAAALAGVAAGVQLLRVHDVADTVQAVKIWSAMTEPVTT